MFAWCNKINLRKIEYRKNIPSWCLDVCNRFQVKYDINARGFQIKNVTSFHKLQRKKNLSGGGGGDYSKVLKTFTNLIVNKMILQFMFLIIAEFVVGCGTWYTLKNGVCTFELQVAHSDLERMNCAGPRYFSFACLPPKCAIYLYHFSLFKFKTLYYRYLIY